MSARRRNRGDDVISDKNIGHFLYETTNARDAVGNIALGA
jgi:hypothetical protein